MLKLVGMLDSPYVRRVAVSLQMLGLQVMLLDTVDGFNYSRGKPVSIGLYGRVE